VRLFDTVPNNWSLVKLTDVTDINPTHPDDPPMDHELASFVPMKKIEELTGRMDPSEVREWSEINTGYTRFQEGDVVFAKITPSMENGKAALARNLKNGVASGSTELHVIRPSNRILAEYILYFVLQEGFRREAEASMTGTAGHMRVPTEFMNRVEIPLPPIEEQRQISELLMQNFSIIEKTEKSLQACMKRSNRLRQSILKHAFEGKLVSQEPTKDPPVPDGGDMDVEAGARDIFQEVTCDDE